MRHCSVVSTHESSLNSELSLCFPGVRTQKANELWHAKKAIMCDTPKTRNFDTPKKKELWYIKKQGIVVRHIKGKLHMFQCVIFVETWYHAQWKLKCNAVQPSVFAFAMLAAQFASSMATFSGSCWNKGHFQCWYYSFYNLEIKSILLEMSKYYSTNLTANQQRWISMWNEFIRAWNCGEQSALWQTDPSIISSFSEL